MVKVLITALLVLSISIVGMTQVAINSDGSLPDSSAGLDIGFTDRGFLPPRMTRLQMYAIQSPPEGLVVYCTDCGDSGAGTICVFSSGGWSVTSSGCLPPVATVAGTHVPQLYDITWHWLEVAGATGYKWGQVNDYSLALDMGTETQYNESFLPCNSSYLRYAWAYDSCGASVSAILAASTLSEPSAATTAGTNTSTNTEITWNWNMVFGVNGYKWNTANNYETAQDMGFSTTKTETGLTCSQAYTRYVWTYGMCGHSDPVALTFSTTGTVATPASASHGAGQSSITWNWNTVTGASGYKWNTTNNYSTAVDMGTATSRNETGLTCNTAYTRYVWAYNSCGYSTARTLNFSTTACASACPASVTDPRDSKVYGVVNIGNRCWFTKNMNVGTRINGTVNQSNNSVIEKYCYNDQESNCDIYGGLYQWGETVQYVNGASNITNYSPPVGPCVSGICPSGWCVASQSDWDALVNYLGGAAVAGGKMKESGTSHWAAPNTGATNSSGFTGLPGGIRMDPGVFTELTLSGYFWSSTPGAPTAAFARLLSGASESVVSLSPLKVSGLSVRCVKIQ